MRLRSALLAAASFGLPAAAMAQPITGLYIAGGGGGSLQQDEVVRASPALGTPGFKARFNAGGTGVASVGYGFGNGMRIELEGDYRYNSIEKIEGGTPATAGGNQEQYGAMVNGLYDFDFGFPYAFPYVGVGAGYQWTRWNHVHNVAADGSYFLGSDNSFGNFAYQGIVGVAFPVAPMPGLSATVEYRFLGEEGESSMKGANYTPLPGGGFHEARGNWDFDNEFNHSIMVGLRYAFGVVPPPPPPPPAPAPASVPAPAPARTYLVFFDWDKADLTDRARQIIHDAADASTHVQTTRIDVDGYTDLSGTPKYNMGLSIRRADAVKAELIRDGVPDNEIEAQGFGETHPLVPTAQGVREPQNRRVEIILR